MSNTSGLVTWICKIFSKSDVFPPDEFQQENPHFRNFKVDEKAALTAEQLPPEKKKRKRRRITR
jgi:hypothetical protein